MTSQSTDTSSVVEFHKNTEQEITKVAAGCTLQFAFTHGSGRPGTRWPLAETQNRCWKKRKSS
jgi:hypothetical protein